ncbi:exocrine gland-secreted peptide 1-like [Meriones unguiculatus]|uniref:exocrine gland-secreted peptide 1-like n=1 Tax=Meriones unguiculatus TaxID=10047 RepID=UPI00293EBD8A|nr:exocrine gland-secreted peptide 1-like [Meriones unguiculatus]
MASLPVMLFLMTLLLPSIFTEGNVLTQTQKGPIISADHKTNHSAVLEKTDYQSEENIKEVLERIICASHQDQILFENLANDNQHKLRLSQFLTALSKCLQKHGVLGNVSHVVLTLRFTGFRYQQDNYIFQVVLLLDEFLKKVGKVLTSRNSS